MQSVVGVAMVPEAILEKLEPMHTSTVRTTLSHSEMVTTKQLATPLLLLKSIQGDMNSGRATKLSARR